MHVALGVTRHEILRAVNRIIDDVRTGKLEKPGASFLLGAQIMWNCITPSLAVCKAAGADFTRCTALAGDTDSMYGKIVAQPLKVAEYRRKIEANEIGLLAEISGYHHKGKYDSENISMRPRR